MKKLFLFIPVLLVGITLTAQQAIFNAQSGISPEVHSDNRVTFRLFAPNAKTVQVTGDFLPAQKSKTPYGEVDVPGVQDMTRSAAGLWEFTTARPLASELYSYSFLLDSVKISDPNNVYQIRDVGSVTSVFIIGGGQADLYKVNAVAHGTVARRWYNSMTLQKERRLTVYTPPGYESSKTNYPVLYLLHGMGGDEEAWIALGRTAQILDNLIAQGKAKPMIVVMTNGNVAQEAAPGESALGYVKPTMQLPNTMDGTMEKSFPDVMKFVEQNYRTIQQKSGRAIAGLSMGGFHSLHISKEYPDQFDYVGLFSAAIMPMNNTKSAIYENFNQKLKKQFDLKPKLYWIAIGKTDFLYKANQDFRKILDENKYPYKYFENEEGHIWKNWRIYLADFATMIF
ncbi:esterase [Gynurincola endophyticus]|uniref:esterase n=1 Tax=Gynurincola endophyticus TaxID=2479004 RepID=UPI000F8C7B4A|nr:esterase [Gynurincola endophyticus]